MVCSRLVHKFISTVCIYSDSTLHHLIKETVYSLLQSQHILPLAASSPVVHSKGELWGVLAAAQELKHRVPSACCGRAWHCNVVGMCDLVGSSDEVACALLLHCRACLRNT